MLKEMLSDTDTLSRKTVICAKAQYVTYEELTNESTAEGATLEVLRFLGVDDSKIPPPLPVTMKQDPCCTKSFMGNSSKPEQGKLKMSTVRFIFL